VIRDFFLQQKRANKEINKEVVQAIWKSNDEVLRYDDLIENVL
jgi:hypothetical protein